MRRSVLFPLFALAAGLGLAACGSDSSDAATTVTATVVSTQSDATQPDAASTPGNSGIVPPAKRGEALCKNGGDAVCVVQGQHVTGELDFERYRVVKLIDSVITGDVSISNVEQAIVTGSEITGDLDIESSGNAVVKMNRIAGDLEISGARNATVVKNTVAGDLDCEVSRANGTGNAVTGTTTGACVRLRG